MSEIMPYIVSILCALISGFTSYFISRKQTKADIQKLEKQYELDLEKEREKFKIEKERLEIEHKHQMELQKQEVSNQLGVTLVSKITDKYLETPQGQTQLRNAGNKRTKHR